jgi:hypothetical protein
VTCFGGDATVSGCGVDMLKCRGMPFRRDECLRVDTLRANSGRVLMQLGAIHSTLGSEPRPVSRNEPCLAYACVRKTGSRPARSNNGKQGTPHEAKDGRLLRVLSQQQVHLAGANSDGTNGPQFVRLLQTVASQTKPIRRAPAVALFWPSRSKETAIAPIEIPRRAAVLREKRPAFGL